MALGSLQTKEKVSAAPPAHLTAQERARQNQCADRNSGTKFWQRAISLYLAVTPRPPASRPLVSVRFLRDFSKVCSRSISGSLLQRRISGGSKTFPEQSQTRVVVDSRRGVAAQRRFACRVLPSASIGRGNVRALAQRAHWRGGSTQAYGISDGIAPREASRRARKRTETTPAAAL